MSIGYFSLTETSLSELVGAHAGKKAPPKRTAIALTDRKLVPEPR